jgi:hypothetical protein
MAKKTGKANLGPEMAKKAYEAKLSAQVPYSPEWDGKPMRQKETWDNTKVTKVKPGKTVIGALAKGVGSGGVAGLALGAVAAYKAELKTVAEAKKKKNRMN